MTFFFLTKKIFLQFSDIKHINCVFTKIHAWKLTEYDKVVLLDVDTIMLKNSDELFERPGFTAAPDLFPPDVFNTGVLVLEPSLEVIIFSLRPDNHDFLQTYQDIRSFRGPSWDMTDQQFLNSYVEERIGRWFELPAAHRLPFVFNALTKLKLHNLWAWNAVKDRIQIAHFSGWEAKPWQKNPGRETSVNGDLEIMDLWHDHYARTPAGQRLNRKKKKSFRFVGYSCEERRRP